MIPRLDYLCLIILLSLHGHEKGVKATDLWRETGIHGYHTYRVIIRLLSNAGLIVVKNGHKRGAVEEKIISLTEKGKKFARCIRETFNP